MLSSLIRSLANADRPQLQHLSWQRRVVDHGSTRMVREDVLFVPVLTPRERAPGLADPDVRSGGNPGRRQSISAIGRNAVLRYVLSRFRPLPATAPVGASATRRTRRGGPQAKPTGCRLSPPTSSVTRRYLKPAPSMTRRWPHIGSACRPAIRCRNAGWLRCLDAHPAGGHERESLTHDKHHRSKTRRAPRPWLNWRRWRANSEP